MSHTWKTRAMPNWGLLCFNIIDIKIVLKKSNWVNVLHYIPPLCSSECPGNRLATMKSLKYLWAHLNNCCAWQPSQMSGTREHKKGSVVLSWHQLSSVERSAGTASSPLLTGRDLTHFKLGGQLCPGMPLHPVDEVEEEERWRTNVWRRVLPSCCSPFTTSTVPSTPHNQYLTIQTFILPQYNGHHCAISLIVQYQFNSQINQSNVFYYI